MTNQLQEENVIVKGIVREISNPYENTTLISSIGLYQLLKQIFGYCCLAEVK